MSSMKNGVVARRWLAWTNFSKSSCPTSPRRMRSEDTPRFLGKDAQGELLGRHFHREEADDGAVLDDRACRRLLAGPVGAGGVEGDVGGERGLAHRGPAGQDDQIGGVQPAQQLVEIGIAGRDAGRLAAALERRLGHDDGGGERGAEGRNPPSIWPVSARSKSRFSAVSICCVAARSRSWLIGLVDDVLADGDELAPQIEVVDGAAVILGIDDRHRPRRRGARDTARRRLPAARRPGRRDFSVSPDWRPDRARSACAIAAIDAAVDASAKCSARRNSETR